MNLGHYYETNYQGALGDFTVRSGLLDENRLFSEDEMAVLYASCVFRGRHDDDLTFESEKELQAVIEKLESNLPQQSMAQEAAPEQEVEHGI